MAGGYIHIMLGTAGFQFLGAQVVVHCLAQIVILVKVLSFAVQQIPITGPIKGKRWGLLQ